MTGLEIAALAAMIAGAGVQYKASSDAQRRQREEIARSLASQRELQMQAEKKALDTAQTYDPGLRTAEQEQIATDIEQSLITPVSESQTIRAQQATTQGDVSDDYTQAKATADLNTIKQAEQLARLLGKTTSASRLRMNEGIRLMDAGQAVDQLNSFSRGQQGADNIAIQQAGLVDPGMTFAGSLLQTAGSAGLMAGAGKPASTGTTYSLSPSALGANPSATIGTGLKPGMTMGLKPNSFVSAFPG